MKILALDPSSLRTGWAWAEGIDIVDAGLIIPKASLPPLARIEIMCGKVGEIVRARLPERIVIEIPEGKIHGRLNRQKVSGMSIYGMAVGAIWWHCYTIWDGYTVDCVGVNEWTRGTGKEERKLIAPHLWPEYTKWAAKDRGGDMSDAISLADFAVKNVLMQRARGAREK